MEKDVSWLVPIASNISTRNELYYVMNQSDFNLTNTKTISFNWPLFKGTVFKTLNLESSAKSEMVNNYEA